MRILITVVSHKTGISAEISEHKTRDELTNFKLSLHQPIIRIVLHSSSIHNNSRWLHSACRCSRICERNVAFVAVWWTRVMMCKFWAACEENALARFRTFPNKTHAAAFERCTYATHEHRKFAVFAALRLCLWLCSSFLFTANSRFVLWFPPASHTARAKRDKTAKTKPLVGASCLLCVFMHGTAWHIQAQQQTSQALNKIASFQKLPIRLKQPLCAKVH